VISPQLTNGIMAGLVFILSARDASFSERRILKYGAEIETSRVVRWCIEVMPLNWALAAGIGLPTLVISGVLWHFNLTIPLAMWLGAKLLNAHFQYLSQAVEAEIDRLRSGSMAASSLPSDDSHPGDTQ
jgi:hypothetical protein